MTMTWNVLLIVLAGVVAFMSVVLASHLRGQPAASAVPRRVGPYALLSRIGQGGMGEVWLGRHVWLGRAAAVKLIRPELLSAEPHDRDVTLRRFAREAQATAALRSPHTVRVYDVGISRDGAVYYAMELLDGQTLDQLVRQHGPLDAFRAIALLRQVCASLAEAHDRGLVHCDIKPSNILLCHGAQEPGLVKVLDFGLVRRAPGPDHTTRLTQQGKTAGTPAFMAPEVALSLPSVDARSDIYALGCVAYWLLTGRQVFEAATPIATALAHVTQAVTPPSVHTRLRIPNSLEELVMACLSKSAEDRPQTAVEVARRLELIAGTESIAELEPAHVSRERWVSRSNQFLAASQSRDTVSDETSRMAAVS